MSVRLVSLWREGKGRLISLTFHLRSQCYKLYTEKLSWDSAQYECSCTGGHSLAKIESVEENTFVNSLLGGEDAWIGLNDKTTEGSYVWTDGSALGTFKPWDSSQPNPDTSDNQDCVKIEGGNSGSWDDVGCNGAKKFVCESDVASSSSTQANTCTSPTTAASTSTVAVTTPNSEKCDNGWWHYAAGSKCVKVFTNKVCGVWHVVWRVVVMLCAGHLGQGQTHLQVPVRRGPPVRHLRRGVPVGGGQPPDSRDWQLLDWSQ